MVLKAYREKRKRQNEQTTESTELAQRRKSNKLKLAELEFVRIFLRGLSKQVRTCSFLRSSIDSGRDAFLRYDRLIVDGQPYQYDYDQKRPVPIRK